jgi:hypothetical protein
MEGKICTKEQPFFSFGIAKVILIFILPSILLFNLKYFSLVGKELPIFIWDCKSTI